MMERRFSLGNIVIIMNLFMVMKLSCISKHDSSYNTKALLLVGGAEPA